MRGPVVHLADLPRNIVITSTWSWCATSEKANQMDVIAINWRHKGSPSKDVETWQLQNNLEKYLYDPWKELLRLQILGARF